MEPVEITWNVALKIWVAIFWRSILLGILPLLAVNIAKNLWGIPPSIGNVLQLLVSFWASAAVLKWWILGKDFGDFKLWPIREISN